MPELKPTTESERRLWKVALPAHGVRLAVKRLIAHIERLHKTIDAMHDEISAIAERKYQHGLQDGRLERKAELERLEAQLEDCRKHHIDPREDSDAK